MHFLSPPQPSPTVLQTFRSEVTERKNQAKRLETSGTCFVYPEGSERVTAAFILQGQMKRAPFPLPFLESGIQSFFIFSSPGISAVSYLPKSSYKVMLTVCTMPIIFSDFLLQSSPTMVRLIRHRCNLKITSWQTGFIHSFIPKGYLLNDYYVPASVLLANKETIVNETFLVLVFTSLQVTGRREEMR